MRAVRTPRILLLVVWVSMLAATPGLAQQLPSALTAADLPNDSGHGLLIRWELSPDDSNLLGYEIYRVLKAGAPDEERIPVGMAARGATSFEYTAEEPEVGGKPNPAYIAPGKPVDLLVRSRSLDGTFSPWSSPITATARGNWFHTGKVNTRVRPPAFGHARRPRRRKGAA